jgi:very-short-patch-repair endonuclease
MNEKTHELKLKFANRIMPVAELLRKDGASDNEIIGYVNKFIDIEIKKFYKEYQYTRQHIGVIIDEMINNFDSRAEMVVFNRLKTEGIEFKSQYKISRYRVDFLIKGFLVLEIDGPHHGQQKEYDAKRDKYLKGLGYEVLRLPIWVFSVDERAAIEAIKELINQN